MLTVGSLFAGIGGFDLGLERTGGFRTVWQVENDPYAQRVLGKHWPGVRRWGDVRTFPPEPAADWRCDVVCGGFPCQDISDAGACRGIEGKRSGLWAEFSRIVRVLRPRFILVENVAALTRWGIGRVLGDLAAGGFDAEWDCLPAAAVGADHIRDRVFIVAYPAGHGGGVLAHPPYCGGSPDWPAGDFWGKERHQGERSLERRRADSVRRAGERGVSAVVDGVPGALDPYRLYGNAVVPQVAEWIGRRILECVAR